MAYIQISGTDPYPAPNQSYYTGTKAVRIKADYESKRMSNEDALSFMWTSRLVVNWPPGPKSEYTRK